MSVVPVELGGEITQLYPSSYVALAPAFLSRSSGECCVVHHQFMAGFHKESDNLDDTLRDRDLTLSVTDGAASLFRWSADGKYLARKGKDLISIYELPSMRLLDKKSLKVPMVLPVAAIAHLHTVGPHVACITHHIVTRIGSNRLDLFSGVIGGGCIGLRVESQGQRAGVLGTGAGQRPSASFSGGNPFPERAPPKEPGDGQRVPPSLAGKRTPQTCLL